MYWPLGTPRIYATSSSIRQQAPRPVVSHDGLIPPDGGPEPRSNRNSLLSPGFAGPPDGTGTSTAPPPSSSPVTPVTPMTPLTPGIKSVEHGYPDDASPEHSPGPAPPRIPLHEPIVALRVARAGHIFAVITATSMTVWQTKVREPVPRTLLFLPYLSDFPASQPSFLLS